MTDNRAPSEARDALEAAARRDIALSAGNRAMLAEHDGVYYLAEFHRGVLVSLDGPHDGPEGVAKALKITRAIGLERPGRVHKMLRVDAVPDLDPPIDNEAAAACRAMLDRFRARTTEEERHGE